MTLRVYNTLSRTKESFAPVNPPNVGIYLCGPTVYKSPHIGHMVGPVIFDAIKRYLVYKGFKVTWVVNITDVDDKLIDKARELGTPVEALAEKHTREYHEILSAMGVDQIDRFPKASEHIGPIIAMCQKLIDRGHAYAAGGNVYFNVTTDPDYGKLSHRKVEEQESGLRDVTGSEVKKNPADFALWKTAKPGEPAWDSPWGKGRPGWHIECSAMSSQYLGDSFDIHGGGMDLLFPHHENELAQSESASGRPFVKYWMHNGLTRIRTKDRSGEWETAKMAGSVGNVVPAADLVRQHGADVVRYFLLSTHYRSPIEYTDQVLSDARKGLAAFTRVLERIERLTGKAVADDAPAAAALGDFASHRGRFEERMDDDFNSAGAIAELHDFASALNGFIEHQKLEQTKDPAGLALISAAGAEFKALARILGLFRVAAVAVPPGEDASLANQLMALLIELRASARKGKNFAVADGIRDGLTKLGITLEDRADGTIWRKG